MDDLVKWLTAQLDEDERIAREAGGLAWSRPAEYLGDPAAIRDSEQERVVCDEGWPSEGQKVHIAEHDPARVLREIEAKRRLLDEVLKYEAKIDGEWGCYHDGDEIAAGECAEIQPQDITALRLLALPYADRPGYQEGWAP